MSKKESFITMVENLLENNTNVEISKDAIEYFESLKKVKEAEKPKFTEVGLRILQFMQDNKSTFDNMFKAKEIGEGIFISSRGVSGAIRKLVADGYVEKMGADPIVYSLTELGETVELKSS